MKRMNFSKITASLLAVFLFIGLLPTGIVSAETTVYPTTWEELREAMQANGEAEIIVSKDVTIERTFDYVNEYADYTEIVVNGKKTLNVYGDIEFYNGLYNGLFCLDSPDDDLTVTGGGSITYKLYNEMVAFESDMFYLTAGKLTLKGGTFFKVDYAYLDETARWQQAVVGGTGGTVVVDYAFLYGNTIFGDGIHFHLKKAGLSGMYRGEHKSYHNLDLYMITGSVTFENADFDRGIDVDPDGDAVLVMGEDVVCIDKTDKTNDADKEDIVKSKPCTFVKFDFDEMNPAMNEGATYRNLGEIGLGDELEIEAWNPFLGTGQGGKELQILAELYVLCDGEQVYYDSTNINSRLTYDFENAKEGYYYVGFTLNLMFCEKTIRTLDYAYNVKVTDNITHVDLALDKTDMNSLESLDDYAGLSRITWYEKSKTGDTWTANPTALRDGYTYAVEFSVLSIGGAHAFADGYTVSVNGDAATKQDNGCWRFEFLKKGYLTRIEMYDIQRPAPGQHPDFIATKDNPPYSSYEIMWYAFKYLEDNVSVAVPMTAQDVFEPDTFYCVEVLLTVTNDDYEFDYYTSDNGAYAYIDNLEASVYYPDKNDHSVIMAYTYFHTSNCITDLEIGGVQYPIGGKTPTDYTDVTDERVADAYVEWYYETNPGTAAAGFSKLDGRYKTDRRHQAYVALETVSDDYWFATDSQGNLEVNVTMNGEPVDFSYTTDTYPDEGAVNSIEVAKTFDLAKNMDGVFVDGLLLTDGTYLNSDQWTVKTEETVDKEEGYAYYDDGVLTLHDFSLCCYDDYDAIASFQPLTVHVEGENNLITNSMGINISKPLTLTGDRDAKLDIVSDQYGIFVDDTLTVDGGNWRITNTTYDGIWVYDDFTVNDGCLYVYGGSSGIWGDDWPTLSVNGGSLVAESPNGNAIAWCVVKFSDEAVVRVGDCGGATTDLWNGTTDFDTYGHVSITVPSDEPAVLKGDVNSDGEVDIYDAMRLFKHVNEEITLEGDELASGELNGDSEVDIYDAMRLFKYVNEEIDEL